jgi:M6 family metalloprotease-like protein
MYYPMNKKFYLLIAVLLMCVCNMKAVPAHPGTVKVQQPDGSFVTLRLLGDEWQHFQTTADGYSVVKNQQGYYVYAEKKNGQLEATSFVAHDEAERKEAELAYLSTVKKYQAPDMSERLAQERQLIQLRQQEILASRRAQGNRATNYQNFRGLIILIEFDDKGFSREDYPEIMNDMVNKEGYTGFDNQVLTGSVRDYFSDNSGGKFQPHFDIAGPYKVPFSQFDCNINKDNQIGQILKAAIDSADVVGNINFKDYDGDGDGKVDLVYFIVAGNGANYSGNDEDLWWPHRSGFWGLKKDGVNLQDYASSTELLGYMSRPSTVRIDGIGTICHEFSHVLGLPDFYDSDYEKSGGQSNDPGDWSLMASGCYADNGDTPVGYSLYERYSVGFCAEPEKITAEGSYTLEPLFSSFTGFRIDSPVNKEFFLFENRQKNDFKWDKFLPGSGMLVHRVDKTNNNVWFGNTVNANPDHNYYEVVRAGGTSHGSAADVFPGTRKVKTLNANTTPANLKTWSGKATRWGLKNIQMANGIVTFDIEDIYVLKALSLPESFTVGLGLVAQLEAIADPDYAIYQLTWSSSDESIATVDLEGFVKGVSAGSCTVTVTSNNGLQASCTVIVEEINAISVDDFKLLSEGDEAILQLTDAEVLYVTASDDIAYVRDANGSIMFKNTGFQLKKNDVLNGYVYAKVGEENEMRQVLGIEGKTDLANVTLIEGEEVEPREVQLEDLTEYDYSDYVVVKAVQIVKEGRYNYAVSGDKRLRIWNKYAIKTAKMPSNTTGKYYDVTSIFGTDVLSGEVIDELYLMASPVEVEAPTAINEVRWKKDEANGDIYNLNGQRVDLQYKGLVIRNGRVVLNK